MKVVKYLLPLLTVLLLLFLFPTPSAGAIAEESGTSPRENTLSPPTFHLSPLCFTYDGLSHILKVENLTHEREEEGFYTFSWYKDGRLLESSAPLLHIRDVSDSGSYTVSVTFTVGGESVLAYSSAVVVSVSPMEIVRPTPMPTVYNGTHQRATLEGSPYYKITKNDGGTERGEYPLTVELCDPENTVWQDGDASPYTTTFEILQAKNEWLEESFVLDTYLGTPPTFGGYPRFGTPTLSYAKEKEGPYSLVLPGSTGTLYARVFVEQTSNYTALYGEVFEIEIRENLPVSIRLEAPPDKSVYTAFESVDLTGIRISVTHMDGTVTLADIRSLRVLYDTYPSTLSALDSGVTVAYGDLKARLPLTVKKASYSVEHITFESGSLLFTGEYLTLTPSGECPVGKDGFPLRMDVSGGGTDAGIYTVTLSFHTESQNYECPSPRAVTLTILPKTVALQWEMQSFVYDGTLKTPVASFYNVFGALSYAQVEGGKIKAGQDYIATATPVQNYIFENDTVLFHIEKGEYDFTGVMWSAETFTYDSTQKEVRLTGLPEGVSVIAYQDNRKSGAGEYTATATLAYDSENYNPPSCPPHPWRIDKARYDLSTLEVLGGTVVYDGRTHVPTVVGALPTGLDGIRLSLSFQGSVTHVKDGEKEILVIFSTTSKNYETPSPITVTLAIVPAPISVVWDNLTFVYDGEAHRPTASCEGIPIAVSGEQSTAGEYIATAHSQNDDYYIKNPKVAFVIQKTRNEWLIPLTVKDVFTSGTPEPKAGAKYGEVVYTFLDGEGREVSFPTDKKGEYTCIATVPESENYTRLTSTPVPFTVHEVVPTGLVATLKRADLYAYERLTVEDLSVELLYNDGTKTPLTDFTVSYARADSLRAQDTYLTVLYGAWQTELPITVRRATLRTEDVVLSLASAPYRKEGYTLEVLSLPEGSSLLSLSGEAFLEVGVYEVEICLVLDPENYEGDGKIIHTVTIEPLKIQTPTIAPLTYTAQVQAPTVPESEYYTVARLQEGKNAGEYEIILRLTDPKNTAFEESGTDTLTLAYTIMRAPITITLGDVTVYRDGTRTDLTYSVTRGDLFSGDTLTLHPVNGDTVCATASHENYEITIINGNFIYSSRNRPLENENSIWWLSVIVLAVLLALLLLNIRPARKQKTKPREGTPPTAPTSPTTPEPPTPPTCEVEQITFSFDEPSREQRAGAAFVSGEEKPNEGEERPVSGDEDIPSGEDEDSILIFDVLPSAECENDEEPATSPLTAPERASGGALIRFFASAFPRGKKPQSRNSSFAAQENILHRTEAPSGGDYFGVSEEEADRLLSDRSAEALLEHRNAPIVTYGKRRAIINIDTLCAHFSSGERIDIEILKSRALIPYDTLHIKVLARGTINKPLYVFANDFSLCAIKMLLLSGGKAVRQKTKSIGFSFGKKPKRKS